MSKISVDSDLLKCPNCQAPYIVRELGNKANSECACGYSEVAGSPYLSTFFGQCLKRKLHLEGFSKAAIGNKKIAFEYLFSPRGCLHFLLQDTQMHLSELFKGADFNAQLFTYIPDQKSILGTRVVISPNLSAHQVFERVTSNLCTFHQYVDSKHLFNSKLSTLQLGDLPYIGETIKRSFPNNFKTAHREMNHD